MKPATASLLEASKARSHPILKPLIFTAQRLTLDEYERLALTTWILTRSMIWDGIERIDKGRYYTQSERVQFATCEPLELPPNMFVWIGLYDGEIGRAAFNVANHVVSEDDGTHLITAVMNQVAFQLLIWKGEGWGIDHDKVNRSALGAKAVRIWPWDGQVIGWPLAAHLDRESLQALSKRFRVGNRTMRGLSA